MTEPSSATLHENLIEEVDALKAIYVNEVEIEDLESSDEPTKISVHLYPATADRAEEQYVKLTLVLRLPLSYPNDAPAITVRNPRGLSDEDLLRITNTLTDACEAKRGSAMLYELVELVKDFLTEGNRPYGVCCICLSGFHNDDVFIKTSCFHHFHSHCLARYVTSQTVPTADTSGEQNVPCPVCREAITCDVDNLANADPPVDSRSDGDSNFLEELREVQAKMKVLFEKQKSQGGIIDVEAEKSKYLLEISAMPDAPVRNAEPAVPQKGQPDKKPSKQEVNTQNVKKPIDNPLPESVKAKPLPRQPRQAEPFPQGQRRSNQDPDERWKPREGYPERAPRFDDRRPRGAPNRRRWQGPPASSGRGHQPSPAAEPGTRQPSNRQRVRQGGFSGRNFFRSPNVAKAVTTPDNNVTRDVPDTEEPVRAMDTVKQPVTEARSSGIVGFATKNPCNMWTVSGPPPGFMRKPAFTSRNAVSATPVLVDTPRQCRD